jgi:ABC-type branched-subunit amino acid transport system substrate-binding protein
VSPTGGTGAPAGSGAAAGSRRVTTPLKVGIILTAVSNAAQYGVKLGNTYDERQVYDAIVASLNAQGGLAGRKIVPVYAKTDTGSNNWETDFAAACATFTQDNHVDAVLGYAFAYYASFESCLAKHQVPHLNTGFNIPDEQELRGFPLFVPLIVPTIERRSLAKIDGGVAAGFITKASKIGLITDTCPGTARSLEQTVRPAIKRRGLTVAAESTLDCVNGASGSGGAVASVQNAVLAFKAQGVDRILIHGVAEAGPLLLFATSAESQNYRPGYALSSLAQLSILGGQIPKEQARNVHGFGWLETQDVPPQDYRPHNSLQKRCLALLKSRGISPVSAADYSYAYNLCEAVFVYERALDATGGSSNGSQILSAIQSLGTSFASTMNLGGSVFGKNRRDAVSVERPLLWREACSCYAYTGAARQIPFS